MPLPPEPAVDAADPEFRAALADRLRRLLARYRYAALEFDDLFQETVQKVISAVRSGQFSLGIDRVT